MDAKSAVPTLLIALDDSDIGVRAEAAMALGKIDPSNAVVLAAIRKKLRDKNEFIRQTATIALGHMGPDAKPPGSRSRCLAEKSPR